MIYSLSKNDVNDDVIHAYLQYQRVLTTGKDYCKLHVNELNQYLLFQIAR